MAGTGATAHAKMSILFILLHVQLKGMGNDTETIESISSQKQHNTRKYCKTFIQHCPEMKKYAEGQRCT